MTPRLRHQVTQEDQVFITLGPGVCARVPVEEAKRFALAVLQDLSDNVPRPHAQKAEARDRRSAILRHLAIAPAGAAELCKYSGEIPGYIARTMSDLVKLGEVKSTAKGRGTKALYSITELGRIAIAEGRR